MRQEIIVGHVLVDYRWLLFWIKPARSLSQQAQTRSSALVGLGMYLPPGPPLSVKVWDPQYIGTDRVLRVGAFGAKRQCGALRSKTESVLAEISSFPK